MTAVNVSHDDMAEAGQVLADCTGFDVDPRLLREIIAAHRDLAGLAVAWGWSDTEVREQLAAAFADALLHRPWPANAGPGFDDDLRAAHDAWLAAHRACSTSTDNEGENEK